MRNVQKIFGMNSIYFTIWEMMGYEEFVKNFYGTHRYIITPTEKKNETKNYKKQFYPVM